MSKIQERTYKCGMELTMDVIGGKWKTVILWHLRNRTLRFSQLKRRLHGITQKMLTQQLRELEEDGLIDRTVFPQVPPKVEYNLTDYGKKIIPVLYSIYCWGIHYAEDFDLDLDIDKQILEQILNREL
ncbi:winged helix-turn-helix transcriptional regulator [Clostridium sp. JNZ J1-5]|nr:helix-turn-helix domain-containing protein [Clostridium sp.]